MAQTRSTPYRWAEVREIVALKFSISPWLKGRAASSSRGAVRCPSSTRRFCCGPTAVLSPADHPPAPEGWHQCLPGPCSSTPPAVDLYAQFTGQGFHGLSAEQPERQLPLSRDGPTLIRSDRARRGGRFRDGGHRPSGSSHRPGTDSVFLFFHYVQSPWISVNKPTLCPKKTGPLYYG